MKLQFSTKSMLWATAFVAVTIAGIGPLWQTLFGVVELRGVSSVLTYLWNYAVFMLPIFLPLIFAAYAIGRRSITWQIVLSFAATEVVAYLLWRSYLAH